MINVKYNWGCCFWILIIYLFVRKIDTWTFGTTTQHTFTVCQCMLILRICTHYRLCHIRQFGINMTSMWNHYILICFIYMIFYFTRPSVLSILALIFQFFKYLSRQDSNDECILLTEMQYSQPQMTLYCTGIFKLWWQQWT